MPVLLQETEISLQWSDIINRVHRPPVYKGERSPGIHLMADVLRPVLLKSGILKPLDKEQLELDEMPLRMAIGMAVEAWFQGLWPDMIWQPGEVVKDGVIGTPDGLTTSFELPDGNEVGLDDEFKATWCSRRTYGADITQNKVWIWQFAGYCKMLALRHVRLHVLWMNGDYKFGPPSPVYVIYLLEFTETELSDFWINVVLNNLPTYCTP